MRTALARMDIPLKKALRFALVLSLLGARQLNSQSGILSILGDYRKTVESLEKKVDRQIKLEKVKAQAPILSKLVKTQSLTLDLAKNQHEATQRERLQVAELKKQVKQAQESNRSLEKKIAGLSGKVQYLKKGSKAAAELLLSKLRQDQAFFSKRIEKMKFELNTTKSATLVQSDQYKTHLEKMAKEITWQKKELSHLLDELKQAKTSVERVLLTGQTQAELDQRLKENRELMIKLGKAESSSDKYSKQTKELISQMQATKFERDLLKTSLDQMHDSNLKVSQRVNRLEEQIRQKEALLTEKNGLVSTLTSRSGDFEKRNRELEKTLQDKTSAKLALMNLDFSTKLVDAKREQDKLRKEISALLEDLSAAKKISSAVGRQASSDRDQLVKLEAELADSRSKIATYQLENNKFLRQIGLDSSDQNSPEVTRLKLAQQMKSLQQEVLSRGKATLDSSLKQILENNSTARQLVDELADRIKVLKKASGQGAFEQIFSTTERLAIRVNFSDVYKFFMARASTGLKDDLHFERFKELAGDFFDHSYLQILSSDDLADPDNALLKVIAA